MCLDVCSCHSVIALGGQFTWNWNKVAVNHVLLNAARAVWSPVFFTHHRPHHVSGVRGPENGSLFFRWIVYVIYSGSCLIPLRRSPSATAIITAIIKCGMKLHIPSQIQRCYSEVWEWISNFIRYFTGMGINYLSMLGLKVTHVKKTGELRINR